MDSGSRQLFYVHGAEWNMDAEAAPPLLDFHGIWSIWLLDSYQKAGEGLSDRFTGYL